MMECLKRWPSRKLVFILIPLCFICFVWILYAYKLPIPYIIHANPRPGNTDIPLYDKPVIQVQQKPTTLKNITVKKITVLYEPCMHIPSPPAGTVWPEEHFIHDPTPTNLDNMVHPEKCTVQLMGPATVNLGDTTNVHIKLYDAHGNNRKGGDLVRVWLREETIGAGSVAKVTDHMNGTYDAEITAFWVGRPELRVAIINPREVIAAQFRRRYVCPPVQLLSGNFGNPGGKTKTTFCSYYPQVPGYTELCNLTRANYGRPWFCGKPKSTELSCNNWTTISEMNLVDFGFEKQFLSAQENELFTRKYKGMVIPTNISIQVKSNDTRVRIPTPDLKCSSPDRSHTWLPSSPSGYLYNKQWTTRTCTGRDRTQTLTSCFSDTNLILIGDSTVRQIFKSVTEMVSCKGQPPKITQENKHSFFNCDDPALNFKVEYRLHELPFWTTKTLLKFLKPLKTTLAEYRNSNTSHSKIVILVHIYTHFLSYHSHVFYECLKAMKVAIIDLLDSNPKVRIMIKGPHSYAFDFNTPLKYEHFPEQYMTTHIDMIKRVFDDVKNRVIYLDVADITIATENNDLHPAEYIVTELVNQIFDFVGCPPV